MAEYVIQNEFICERHLWASFLNKRAEILFSEL